MATKGSSTHFFRVILPSSVLQNGTLELPRKFVKEHLKSLSMYARLKLPNGSESKIRMKMCDGRAWLDQGWPEFVDKYSIKCGYFLMFKYKGASRFSVLIFDLTTLEIQYPVSEKTSNRIVEECKAIYVKEEDSHENDDEYALEIRKGQELDNATEFRIEGRSLGATSAREKVLERAMAFESRNPHFSVIMHPVYVSAKYNMLQIPAGRARSYFPRKENRDITLKVADGRAWPVKYSIGAPPEKKVTICKGWNIFVRENHIRKGDVCVFELVNSREMAFKVTIFRISDEQADKNDPLGTPDTASPRRPATTKTTTPYAPRYAAWIINHVDSNAMRRILERPGSFMINMSPCYVSRRHKGVHIPTHHSRRYLRDEKNGENMIILHGSNGKTWPVKYSISNNKMATFIHGWKEFASDNHLRAGDICIFEMITHKVRAYKVTFSRVADRA